MSGEAGIGIGALILSGIGTAFAWLSNRDKNKNDKADVVIGGYDKLYDDIRSELDRKIAELNKLQDQYNQVIVQNSKLIDQNIELQKLGETLKIQIAQLTTEIQELQEQLAKGITND